MGEQAQYRHLVTRAEYAPNTRIAPLVPLVPLAPLAGSARARQSRAMTDTARDQIPADIRARLNAARVEPQAFAREQAAFGRCWTVLGMADLVTARDDWFTATLGGRAVVVQRFEQGLAGFENKCAHRAYPLRNGPRGNGPLVCGFHHWRYNHEGLALGIPHCPEMFGKTPRDMDARLERVDVAQVGAFIFGRFSDPDGPTIEEWLGPALPILKHISGFMGKDSGRLACDVAANWRFVKEISLDDYHLVAVHPSTFGKHGYIPEDGAFYTRFGAHSAYFRGGDADSLPQMVRECEDGSFFPQRYRIMQLFPTTVISFAHALNYLGEPYWYVIVQTIVPEAHDRSRTLLRYFAVPHPPTSSRLRRFLRWLAWPSVNLAFRFVARRVHLEDNEACAALQRVARADDPAPRLARHEQRVGWFEEICARVLKGERPRAS